MKTIAANLHEIRDRISRAAERSGRNPSDITLLAVSKFQSPGAIRDAFVAGQRDFGESYTQEFRTKTQQLADLNIRWHFVGHLQRNKVKYLFPAPPAAIHSVDSLRLAHTLSQTAVRNSVTATVLLQVNTGLEAQKSGCSPEEVPQLMADIAALPALQVRGLMTIPPFDLSPEDTRHHFVVLRCLRDQLGGAERLPELSMGMSDDFEVAIEEGSTIVRVGTAIFGERHL